MYLKGCDCCYFKGSARLIRFAVPGKAARQAYKICSPGSCAANLIGLGWAAHESFRTHLAPQILPAVPAAIARLVQLNA